MIMKDLIILLVLFALFILIIFAAAWLVGLIEVRSYIRHPVTVRFPRAVVYLPTMVR